MNKNDKENLKDLEKINKEMLIRLSALDRAIETKPAPVYENEIALAEEATVQKIMDLIKNNPAPSETAGELEDEIYQLLFELTETSSKLALESVRPLLRPFDN